MKEARFSLSYRRIVFAGRNLRGGSRSTIHAGIVSLGGTFGFYRLGTDGCDGFQINASAGAFSQFNLDEPSNDLINTDFIIGLPFGLRIGRFSARLRVAHQSSHLGDEFLLDNPGTKRRDLAFEWVDALVSYEFPVDVFEVRVYGGGGYILTSRTPLERGLLRGGVEVRSTGGTPPDGDGVNAAAVLGGDLVTFQENHGITASLEGGMEVAAVNGERLRLLVVYMEGFVPFGQFFTEEVVHNYGLELHFEL